MASAKSTLILGGNGALGRAVVSSFKSSGWRVASMDLVDNKEADLSIQVSADHHMKEQAAHLLAQSKDFSQHYDSIICVAGGFDVGNIKDTTIFENFAHQDKINFQSALLAGHIASHTLNQQGMLMFTGAAAVFEGPVNFAYGYYLAKATTHALALQMAERKEVPENSTVVTLLPQTIDTEMNRQAMPDVDKSGWQPPQKIATMIRQWADGENRPDNGSFAKVHYENGVIYPTFL